MVTKSILSCFVSFTEGTETFAPVLRAADVPLMDLDTCRKSQVLGGRQQPILDSMICAGGYKIETFQGDIMDQYQFYY